VEVKGREGEKESGGRGEKWCVCSEHALSHAQPCPAKDTLRTTHREEERKDYIVSPRERDCMS